MFMRMIYDEKLAQAAYLIGCQRTGEAIVVDPERDVDRYVDLADENGLRIVAVTETHVHADFVSGSREMAERIGARVYLSDEGGEDWKYRWLDKKLDGGSYDRRLLRDGDTFAIGQIEFSVIHTPGHTPEHIVFLITDRGAGADAPVGLASGDFVFVGDLGRPDLLETAAGQAGAREPAARRLFQTVRKLDEIPEFVQVWPGHGAGSACGKALGAVPMSTIGYERRFNPAIRAADDESAFVEFILSGQPEPPLYFARMKRVNRDGPAVLGGLPEPKRMTVEQLREIDTNRGVVADTRGWKEFRAGHVPGALSLPLDSAFNTNAGSFIEASEAISLIIEPGRVEEAVRDLIRVGLDRIEGWFDAAEIAAYADGSHSLASTREVDAHEAMEMVASGSVRVLDVRRATEFSEGHIPGAVNIAHTRLASRLEDVPREGTLLVNCRTGVRSARSTAFLERAGFDAMNLRGGIVAWQSAAAAS